jgi:hypothetical protein
MQTATVIPLVLGCLVVTGACVALGYLIAKRNAQAQLRRDLRLPASLSIVERDLWLTWDAFHAWLRWMDHLRSADTAQKEQTALVALAQLPRTTSAAALTAGTALGKSVLQRPWYAAQAAREAGESWEAIGDAMKLSGHNAQLWFQSTAAEL